MRLSELENGKPILYMDMDGVQCDFFSAWARLHHKAKYKEIGDKETRERSIEELNNRGPEFVEEFFATLPPIQEGLALIQWIRYRKIPYRILSSPLRFNTEASIAGKKAWLSKYTPYAVGSAIFLSEKSNLAKTGEVGNILVDDYKKNIVSWDKHGGTGILFRTERVDEIKQQLAEIYRKS